MTTPEPAVRTFKGAPEDLNRIAGELTSRYGFLPLFIRYGIAETILDQQERNRAAGMATADAVPAPAACYDHCVRGVDDEPVPTPGLSCPDCTALAAPTQGATS